MDMDDQQETDVKSLYTDVDLLAACIPLLILGTVANTLTLVVLQRPTFRNKSFAVYLRALAISDIGVVWFWRRTFQMFYLERTSAIMEWEYRVRIGLVGTCSLTSSWMIVLVTIERVIIVFKPEKAKVLCTKRKAIWSVVITTVIIGAGCGLSAGLSSMEEILTDNYSKIGVYIIFYSILPILVIIPSNVLIVVRLHKARAARQMLTQYAARRQSKDRTTAMLITNSFVFVFITVTANIVPIVNITLTVPVVVRQLAECLMKSNHIINIILYCVSGATFRREINVMFQSPCHKVLRPEVMSSTGQSTMSVTVSPAALTHEPASLTHEPAALTQKPASLTQEPASLTHEWARHTTRL